MVARVFWVYTKGLLERSGQLLVVSIIYVVTREFWMVAKVLLERAGWLLWGFYNLNDCQGILGDCKVVAGEIRVVGK